MSLSRYALLQAGIVTAIVEADATPTTPGTWVDVTSATVGPGYQLDGASWVPTPPPPATITLAQLQAAREALGLTEAQVGDLFAAAAAVGLPTS